MEKMERFKIKAERFLINNKRVFIVDVYDNFYSCYIIFVGDESLTVENFAGKLEGIKSYLFWEDIKDIVEFKGKGDL